jgi:hypothetical protein
MAPKTALMTTPTMKESLVSELSVLVAPSEESVVGNTNNKVTDTALLTNEPTPPASSPASDAAPTLPDCRAVMIPATKKSAR